MNDTSNTSAGLWHNLLPPNATALERALLRAILEEFDTLPRDVCRALWNPDACPVELLPWLAWTFALETWDSNWPEGVKRARIKSAIEIARKRGTVGSVRRVLQSYGGNFIIKEWWEYDPPKTPHTFELTLNLSGEDGQAASAEFIESVIDDINRTKPVRSHYTVTQGLTAGGSMGTVAAARCVVARRLVMNME